MLNMMILDIYTILRMFRNFNKFENDKQLDNIIIYYGDYHIDVYRQILNDLHKKNYIQIVIKRETIENIDKYNTFNDNTFNEIIYNFYN